MKYLIKCCIVTFLLTSFIILLVYLLFSFDVVSFNPYVWGLERRRLSIAIVSVILTFIPVIFLSVQDSIRK